MVYVDGHGFEIDWNIVQESFYCAIFRIADSVSHTAKVIGYEMSACLSGIVEETNIAPID